MSQGATFGAAMTDLILFVLASFGAWYVLSTAELPYWEDARDRLMSKSSTFAKFLYCPICSGFWVSLVLSYFVPLTDFHIVQGLAGAAAVYFLEAHMARLEAR